MVTEVVWNILISSDGFPVDLMGLIFPMMMAIPGNGFQHKVFMCAGRRRKARVFF
jgi:hypothetical protein